VLPRWLEHFTKRNQVKNDAGFLAKPQPDSSSIPDEISALKNLLGVGQKFPDEQQHAIDLVNQMKSLGEHQGKENAGLLYAMDVIVDLLRIGRDSSSISTEKTFEEWWNRYALTDEAHQDSQRDARYAWNAAKGPTDPEGKL